MKIPKPLKDRLEKQQYRFIGDHSAVKICEWTKRSLRDEDVCYKQKFYGIQSHECCQMSPAVNFCSHSCIFCWRPLEYNLGIEGASVDDPKKIVDQAIKKQRKLLSGFGGNEKVNNKKLAQAQNPSMFAISLSGEPTVYSHLDGLIIELKKRGIKSFLVTNGTFPEKLSNLIEKAEPDQLYITLPAPNKKIYLSTCSPAIKNGWEKIMKSLKLLDKFSCKKVIRLTLVKGLNMEHADEYAKLLDPLSIDFIEAKGYVWVGYSRKRLSEENMGTHEDIKNFAEEICVNSSFKMIDEKKESRVVLLARA